jgi:nucleoside phosphorylase
VSEVSPAIPALIAATALECKALRRAAPRARVVQTGIALADLHEALGEIVISCGLAGSLRPDLSTGTVVIPREVCRPGGGVLRCDEELVELFAASARRLGVEPVFDPLVTADRIVHGAARAQWAARGYAAVDMETGLLDAPRVAAVRVILDTPQHEISEDWRTPILAILKPWNWPQAMWLAREAPRAASLAARVVAGAQGIGPRLQITRE